MQATEFYHRTTKTPGKNVTVVASPVNGRDKFFVMYDGKDWSEHFSLKAAKRSADYLAARF
jgi:hypothetical protein